MNKVFFGDCRSTMRDMIPDQSVQMCVTSPPYFGLRDYGHEGQIGLESTPEEYIAKLIDVFREVRRVLADDGTLWVNIGDSYASNPASGGRQSIAMTGGEHKRTPNGCPYKRPDGLKSKDLIGIPWMLAFALRADGWYLRQDIIWHKPNPMPESVRDRCTKAHEYLFLLSKSERYYFDSEAMKEPATSGPAGTVRKDQPRKMNSTPLYQSNRGGRTQEPLKQGAMGISDDGKRNRRSVWTVPTTPYSGAHFATFPPALIEPCILAGSRPGDTVLDPFFGSGTTGQVSESLGRQWIGCEINESYSPLQRDRTAQRGLMFFADAIANQAALEGAASA